MSMSMKKPEERQVFDPSDAYIEMVDSWEIVRDFAAGWTALIKKAHTYIPKHPQEPLEAYQIRASRPVFVSLFGRTISGLSGLVFRRDPQLGSDVPAQIRLDWEDIDLQGTHGAVFAREVFRDVLTAGHGAILVDAPLVASDEPLSLFEEAELGIRPYWVYIRPEQIVSWRYDGLRLSQVVLHMPVEEPAGEFGSVVVDYFRVLRQPSAGAPVEWEVWRKEEGVERASLVLSGIFAPDRVRAIPLVPVYARAGSAPLTSSPPLYDLATLNWHHFQVSSDLAHSAHIANVPILFGSGIDAKSISVSPNKAVLVPDSNASLSWVETTGAAIGATREMLQDIESAAAVLGLETLKREARIPETAMARRLDRIEQDSTLAATARSLQDALEACLKTHAQMLGLEDGGSLQLLTDFSRLSLGADEIRAYSELVDKSQLSLATMWDVLVEGGSLPGTFEPDKERGLLEPAAEAVPDSGATNPGGAESAPAN